MLTSEALTLYRAHQDHKVAMGIIRASTRGNNLQLLAELGVLREALVAELMPRDFEQLMAHSAGHWGACRLRQFRHFINGWLGWLEESGYIQHRPKTGKMETPRYRPVPKQVYTPAELRQLWDAGNGLTRSLLGLGLFAGMNCADVAELTEEYLQGQWMVQPRTKTGIPRRAFLPSWVVSELSFPMRTTRGVIHRRQVSTYWRDTTRRLWGAPRPFTALRTTLRTVAGHVDAEALEMCVMGHTPASAAAELGRNRVGLEHYVRADAISDDRLRAITREVSAWLLPRLRRQ